MLQGSVECEKSDFQNCLLNNKSEPYHNHVLIQVRFCPKKKLPHVCASPVTIATWPARLRKTHRVLSQFGDSGPADGHGHGDVRTPRALARTSLDLWILKEVLLLFGFSKMWKIPLKNVHLSSFICLIQKKGAKDVQNMCVIVCVYIFAYRHT